MSECFGPQVAIIVGRSTPVEGIEMKPYPFFLLNTTMHCKPGVKRLSLKHQAISSGSFSFEVQEPVDLRVCPNEPFSEVLFFKYSNPALIKGARVTNKLGLRDGDNWQTKRISTGILITFIQ